MYLHRRPMYIKAQICRIGTFRWVPDAREQPQLRRGNSSRRDLADMWSNHPNLFRRTYFAQQQYVAPLLRRFYCLRRITANLRRLFLSYCSFSHSAAKADRLQLPPNDAVPDSCASGAITLSALTFCLSR
jgi:hypothetical protein